MKSRILIAGLFHETNSFVDGLTPLRDFQIRRGDELLDCIGDASPLGGLLESAREYEWEILPSVDYRATPSGTVKDEVVEEFWRGFVERAEPELQAGIDAIYLVLHGAMVAESFPDVEGEILERIRKLPGAENLPIFGVFDLHANFTQRMAEYSNCLVAYRENPHTDARESAQRAALLLLRCLESGEVPRMYWQHPAIVWPPTGTGTADEPMKGLENLARELEAEHLNLWSVSVAGGFCFADTPDTGVSFCLATTAEESDAENWLTQLSDLALKTKELGNVIEPDIDEVFATLDPLPDGLTVLVEPSENIGAGAPGDCTGLLRALVEHRIANSAIAINDPDAVKRLQTLPIGDSLTLAIGGKGSRLDAGPLELNVQLVSRSDGRFELEDKQSHLASMCGDVFEMGPCAVVKHEGITVLLTSHRTPPFDLGQWKSQGIEPTTLSVICVKAAVAHRRAYDPIATRMLWVNTPGPCNSDLRTLPFEKINRPIYPLD